MSFVSGLVFLFTFLFSTYQMNIEYRIYIATLVEFPFYRPAADEASKMLLSNSVLPFVLISSFLQHFSFIYSAFSFRTYHTLCMRQMCAESCHTSNVICFTRFLPASTLSYSLAGCPNDVVSFSHTIIQANDASPHWPLNDDKAPEWAMSVHKWDVARYSIYALQTPMHTYYCAFTEHLKQIPIIE